VHWRQMVSILLLLVLLTSPPWVKPMHLRAFFVRREMKDPWEIYLLLMIIVCGCFFFSGEALLSFKRGLLETQGAMSNWNESDPDPCGWWGVECHASNRRVSKL
jgi:hypothetical protein